MTNFLQVVPYGQVSDPYNLGSGKSQSKQTMKTNIRALALVFFLLLGVLWMPVKSAVVVSDLTAVQYNQTLSTSTVSWKVEMIAGFPSLANNEVTLLSNITVGFPHVWSIPEQVEVSYDLSGNLTARAGSNYSSVQPLQGFNAILVQIRNLSFSDEATELRSWSVDGTSIRNLFAENTQTGAGFDRVIVTGFDPQFFLTGSFFKGLDSVDRDSVITITGVNIPEPTTLLLSLFSTTLFFVRRR